MLLCVCCLLTHSPHQLYKVIICVALLPSTNIWCGQNSKKKKCLFFLAGAFYLRRFHSQTLWQHPSLFLAFANLKIQSICQTVTEPTRLMTVGNTVGNLQNKKHTIHFTNIPQCLQLFIPSITHYKLLLRQFRHDNHFQRLLKHYTFHSRSCTW